MRKRAQYDSQRPHELSTSVLPQTEYRNSPTADDFTMDSPAGCGEYRGAHHRLTNGCSERVVPFREFVYSQNNLQPVPKQEAGARINIARLVTY